MQEWPLQRCCREPPPTNPTCRNQRWHCTASLADAPNPWVCPNSAQVKRQIQWKRRQGKKGGKKIKYKKNERLTERLVLSSVWSTGIERQECSSRAKRRAWMTSVWAGFLASPLGRIHMMDWKQAVWYKRGEAEHRREHPVSRTARAGFSKTATFLAAHPRIYSLAVLLITSVPNCMPANLFYSSTGHAMPRMPATKEREGHRRLPLARFIDFL